MKMDRITKVVLSAIALLLVVNCARDFSSSSNSSGNSNVLSVERSVAAASPQNWEYQIMEAPDGNISSMSSQLNNLGGQGWELVGFTYVGVMANYNYPKVYAVLKRP